MLTVGRVEIANTVTVKLQELCDQYETGIKVDQIILQDVNPPDPVKPAFNEVNEAQQEREKLINQARSEYNKIIPKAKGDAAKIFEEARDKMTKEVIEAAAPWLKVLGIELLSLRFKRINYVDEVQKKIYERMITERKRIADKFRSEGQGEAAKILGEKERDLKKIQSEAYRTAQEIKGKADAEATTIYAKAYDQSSESRNFYQFLKTMESYKNTLSEKDWLILTTKGDFFKFLEQSGK